MAVFQLSLAMVLICGALVDAATHFPDQGGSRMPPPLPIQRKHQSVAFPGQTGEEPAEGREHAFLMEHHGEAEPEEEHNRLFPLLSSLSSGMQVGLDLRLPFLNVPYGRLLSGLMGGGAGSLLSGGLGGGGLGSLTSLLVGGLLFYPKLLSSIFGDSMYRDAGADDTAHQVNKFLVQHNVDPESCIQTAVCVLGEVHRTQARHPQDSSTAVDVLDSVMNLASIKKSLSKQGLREARDYGESGGDCQALGAKCPVPVEKWRQMITNLNNNL